METQIKKNNKFGIMNNICIPISDDEYANSIVPMESSGSCQDNMGSRDSMSVYLINKINSTDQMFTPTASSDDKYVTIYNNKDFAGMKTSIQEGEYNYQFEGGNQILKKVNSINVPKDYYVFIITGKDIIPLYGPVAKNLEVDRIAAVVVQKHRTNDVILCTNDIRNLCVTYGSGSHILYPALFSSYKMVNLGSQVKELYLYADISATDLIQKFVSGDGKQQKVQYVRTVRSIKVIN